MLLQISQVVRNRFPDMKSFEASRKEVSPSILWVSKYMTYNNEQFEHYDIDTQGSLQILNIQSWRCLEQMVIDTIEQASATYWNDVTSSDANA